MCSIQLHHILGLYGCYIIQRATSDVDEALFKDTSIHSRNVLSLYRHNIFMVNQPVRNDVSSTKVRLFLSRGMSVRYLIPYPVIQYINHHGLYGRPQSSPASSSSSQHVSEASPPEDKMPPSHVYHDR
jgi:nicotinamide mononucleotide adenylyltransferase